MMSDPQLRDERIAGAIQQLPVPDHRVGFFEDLERALGEAKPFRAPGWSVRRFSIRPAVAFAVALFLTLGTIGIVALVPGDVPRQASTLPDASHSVPTERTSMPSPTTGSTLTESEDLPPPLLTDYRWTITPDVSSVFVGDHEGDSIDIRGLASDDGVAVAVGRIITEDRSAQWAAVWISPDGLRWQRVPHDDAVFGARDGDDAEIRQATMRDVVATEAGFVAVGADQRGRPVSWSSANGRDWSVSNVMGTGDAFLSNAAAGHEMVVAAGTSMSSGAPIVFASRNGVAWSESTLPELEADRIETADLVAGPSGFLLLGQHQIGTDFYAAALTSPDGQTWRALEDLPLHGDREPALGPVAATRDSYLVFGWVSGEAMTLTSPDGSNWTLKQAPPELANANDVAIGPAGIVAVGHDASQLDGPGQVVTPLAVVSSTGAEWARLDPEPLAPQTFASLVDVHGDGFIAIGTTRDAPGDAKVGVTWFATPST